MKIKNRIDSRAKLLQCSIRALCWVSLLTMMVTTVSAQNLPAQSGEESVDMALEVGIKSQVSENAKDQMQRDPVRIKSKGYPMRAADVIKESDIDPAKEIDPNVARALMELRSKPDMDAVLAEYERQGQPEIDGELPPFKEAQKFIPRREVPKPRDDSVIYDQEKKQLELASTGDTHLRVVLQLKADGSTEVLSATEMAGGAIFSEAPASDYFYEVTRRGKTISVESLTVNPFEIHSFGGFTDDEQGHYIETVDEATIVVNMPDVTLENVSSQLDFNLYKLEHGPSVLKLNATSLENLRSEKRVTTIRHAPGKVLARDIKAIGTRLKANDER